MQPIHALDDAGWIKLLQDAAYYFDDLTLKRGFQYYKQKRVTRLSPASPGILAARVDGAEPYSVELIPGALSISSCDCPAAKPCKHMAAVLMDYAESQGRPVQLLVNARSAAQVRAVRDGAAPRTALPESVEEGRGANPSGGRQERFGSIPRDAGNDKRENGGRDMLKERGRLIPVMNIAQWHELFARCISPLAGDTRNSRYAEEALAAILRVSPPLEPELEKLLNLHARLFVLDSLTNRSGAHAAFAPSLGYYTHMAVTALQQEIEHGFRTAPSLPSGPEQWNRILDTLAYLRRELPEKSGGQAFYHSLYYLLWRKWIIPQLREDSLFKEELRRLEREGEEPADTPSPQALLTVRAWMHFHLSEDEESLSLLREAAGRPGFLPEWLDYFWEPLAEAGETQRLVHWLTETGDLLYGHLRRNLESYARHWEEAVRLLPEAEPLMWTALTDMLPLSGGIYAEKLLERGRWRQWMDYQLSSGADPADFRVRDLQPLEKHAPELLLPFYHQAVERYVSEKNRSSYKAAVKLLKRLKKLYKKLKTEDRFERFLHAFTARHSRLRALQEELRKGKLTT